MVYKPEMYESFGPDLYFNENLYRNRRKAEVGSQKKKFPKSVTVTVSYSDF
jgi:hypothetical protein